MCGEAKVAAHEALVHKAKGGCVAWAVVGLGVVMVWCALPTTTSVDGLVDGTMVVVVVVWNKAQDTLVINTTTPCARHGCCGVDVVFGD